MKINEKINNENVQYHTNREVAKLSALPSCKIDKCNCRAKNDFMLM